MTQTRHASPAPTRPESFPSWRWDSQNNGICPFMLQLAKFSSDLRILWRFDVGHGAFMRLVQRSALTGCLSREGKRRQIRRRHL